MREREKGIPLTRVGIIMSLRNKQNVHIIQNNNRWSIINLPTTVLGDAFISLKYSSRHDNNNIIMCTRYIILCTRIMTIKKVHNVSL